MWETVTTTFEISFAKYRRLSTSTSKPHYRPHSDDGMNSQLNYKMRISKDSYIIQSLWLLRIVSVELPPEFSADFTKLRSSSPHPNYRSHDDNK